MKFASLALTLSLAVSAYAGLEDATVGNHRHHVECMDLNRQLSPQNSVKLTASNFDSSIRGKNALVACASLHSSFCQKKLIFDIFPDRFI